MPNLLKETNKLISVNLMLILWPTGAIVFEDSAWNFNIVLKHFCDVNKQLGAAIRELRNRSAATVREYSSVGFAPRLLRSWLSCWITPTVTGPWSEDVKSKIRKAHGSECTVLLAADIEPFPNVSQATY
ncbi:MAG: hypothetical protein ABJZ55_10275 [Fuerstiella sp.]